MSRARRISWAIVWVPLVLTALAYRESLQYGLLADARLLITNNRFLTWEYLWENLSRDYFWSSSGSSIGYWRPLTKLSWLLEAEAFQRSAVAHHVVQLAWHLVGVLAVQDLGRQLGGNRLFAALGACLYGLHAAAVEPVCLIMARSDVACTASLAWAFSSWLRWVKSKRMGWLVVHVVATLLALGSKETGVVIFPLVVVWLWLGQPRRWLEAAPALVCVVCYGVLRSLVVEQHGAFTLDLARMFVGSGTYLGGLVPFRFETGVDSIPRTEIASATTWLPALAALGVYLGLVGAAYRRRWSSELFLLAWILLALAPVLVVRDLSIPGVSGKVALADRWLLPSALAASLLFALLAQRGCARYGYERFVAAFVVGWSLLVVVIAPGLHDAYRSETTLLRLEEARYQDTPAPFRTRQDHCRHHSRQILFALEAADLSRALEAHRARPAHCPNHHASFNLLNGFVAAGRYAEAAPIYEELAHTTMDPRYHAPLAMLGGIIRLETGDAKGAEKLLLQAERLGWADCQLQAALGKAAALQRRRSNAARRFRRAYACTVATGNPDASYASAARSLEP